MTYADLYEYNAESGTLSRKPRTRQNFLSDWHHREHLRSCNKPVGVPVSSRDGQRIAIYVNLPKGKSYDWFVDTLAHRIIWKVVHGGIPEGMHIDHINGNPWDNRLCNLRLVNRRQNMMNARAHRTNRHGVKGVSWDKHNEMWQSEIRTNGGRVFLGRHTTKGMAALAYAKASIRYHGLHSFYLRDMARMRAKGLVD